MFYFYEFMDSWLNKRGWEREQGGISGEKRETVGGKYLMWTVEMTINENPSIIKVSYPIIKDMHITI